MAKRRKFPYPARKGKKGKPHFSSCGKPTVFSLFRPIFLLFHRENAVENQVKSKQKRFLSAKPPHFLSGFGKRIGFPHFSPLLFHRFFHEKPTGSEPKIPCNTRRISVFHSFHRLYCYYCYFNVYTVFPFPLRGEREKEKRQWLPRREAAKETPSSAASRRRHDY